MKETQTFGICNICGKKLDVFDDAANYHIHREMGYGSKYDLCKLDLHICTDCMDKMIEDCVKSPIIEEESE